MQTAVEDNMCHPYQAQGIKYPQHPVGHFPYQGERSHMTAAGHGAGAFHQASVQQTGPDHPAAARVQFESSGLVGERLQYQHRTAGDQFHQPTSVQYFQQGGGVSNLGEAHKLGKLPATDAAVVNDSGIESEYEGPGKMHLG